MSADVHFPFSRKKIDLLVIAGEHSGDQHVARYISKLKSLNPKLNIYAFSGKSSADAGAHLLLDMTKFSVIGLAEVFSKYFFFKKLLYRIIAWVEKNKPQVICLVDYPGLNLEIAKILFKKRLSNKAGGPIKVLYYISPQIWAWKEKRKYKLEKYIDSLATIFGFEKNFYIDTKLDVKFVGHPFANINISEIVSYSPEGPILILPGSRISAIKKILPEMLKCFSVFSKKEPSRMATIMYANEKTLSTMRKILNGKFKKLTDKISFISDGKKVETSAALMSSGTMSLKCCLAGIPGIILYKSNLSTFIIGKYILKLKQLGIANILLHKNAWPEFIQRNINPVVIAKYIEQCLDNPKIQQESFNNAEKLKEIISQSPDIGPENWLLSWMKG